MPVRTEKETLERYSLLVEQAKKDGNNDGQALWSALNAMGIQDEAARNRLIGLYRKDQEKKTKAKEPLNKWWEEFRRKYSDEINEIGARDRELR